MQSEHVHVLASVDIDILAIITITLIRFIAIISYDRDSNVNYMAACALVYIAIIASIKNFNRP